MPTHCWSRRVGGAVRYITPQPSLTDFSAYARTELAFTQAAHRAARRAMPPVARLSTVPWALVRASGTASMAAGSTALIRPHWPRSIAMPTTASRIHSRV
jgi:hypothetical protein